MDTSLADGIMNDINKNTQELYETLLVHQLTISTAESCTGGLLTHLITEVPGSSNVLVGGINCYTIFSKTKVLGISEALIRDFTVYSHQVASAMANAAIALFSSDIGISTTGHLSPPEPTTSAFVYIGISNNKIQETHYLPLPYSRRENKLLVAREIFKLTQNFIDKNYN